ncbi:MAG: ABC transporter ATP-binding protein [Thermoleophilia bacterium]
MSGGPLLAVHGLVKVFGAGRTEVRAVDGVDLTTEPGEIALVMGPSGSGKTTLLTMLGGLLRPTAGSILVDGVDLAALDRRRLADVRRHTVGFVFQTFNLLDALTARENVEIALNVAGVRGAAAHDRARELLVEAGLAERLEFRARDLSGGEKQRVSIARALANRPRLLLADEPTANLDSRHGGDVMALLRELATREQVGVVVVSHDARLRSVADRVLWMEDGRLRSLPAAEDAPDAPSGEPLAR